MAYWWAKVVLHIYDNEGWLEPRRRTGHCFGVASQWLVRIRAIVIQAPK
jgi:hypothetical protein